MSCDFTSFQTVFSHIRTLGGDSERLCAMEPFDFHLRIAIAGPLDQQTGF